MKTISELTTTYLEARRQDGYSPATLSTNRLILQRLARQTGDPPIADVTLEMLRDHVAAQEQLALSSKAVVIRTIRAMFKWAWEEDLITGNPSVRLREPKLPQTLPKAITMEELERLRDSCKDTRQRAMLETFFATGARLAELAGMDRGHIDWNRNAVRVVGKGSKEREVYLGARAKIWLQRYLNGRDDRVHAVFVTERWFDGNPRRLSKSSIGSVIKQIATRARLEDRVTPHVLRHTLATTLLNQGAPLYSVQSLLGHAKPETTLRYVHLSGDARKADFHRYFVQ